MFYRETGQIKTDYKSDMAMFPIAQDRWFIYGCVAVAVIGLPMFASSYVIEAFLIPILIWSLAALSLNMLLGYCGQLSLGHGGFMAVGAYAAYNFATRIPELNIFIVFILAGLCAAAVSVLFGLPSIRIKGFYLAVSTLAAQFVIEWTFSTVSWFSGDNAMGTMDTPQIVIFGYALESSIDFYMFCLVINIVLFVLAKNLVRGSVGRSWMAIRDMDVAASVIGIRLLPSKLLAFGVSGFYAGIAGAMYAFVYLKATDITSFDLFQSFNILFMVIIGGMGSVMGAYFGSAFILLLPIVLNITFQAFFATSGFAGLVSNIEHMVFGGLIMFFLIVEPLGLARMWSTVKEKLRLWPFPH
jgi:branched-chain amino acid transport system permease protein